MGVALVGLQFSEALVFPCKSHLDFPKDFRGSWYLKNTLVAIRSPLTYPSQVTSQKVTVARDF